jgi:hypothetical protein
VLACRLFATVAAATIAGSSQTDYEGCIFPR